MLFDDGLNYDVMLKRLKEMIQVLPPVYGDMIYIIKFNCLTELRPVQLYKL
jgi:hypothetical protein